MKLPSLNALRAFEAAARHNGFIGASRELHVTRGAISRHVKVLEEQLGVSLFLRHANGVELSAAGQRLLPALSEAFGRIAETAERISSDASDLRIICPPATSIRWLIPRLEQFRQRHPDIRVRLTTDFHGDIGFDRSEYDIGFSVVHRPNRAPDIEVLPLFPVLLTPACAPSLLDGGRRLRTPAELEGFVLLHETPAHADWKTWLQVFGVPGVDPTTGDGFPNLDIATKAAVMGAGIVMADLVLCREELEAGTLVTPFRDMTCPSPCGDVCMLTSRHKLNEPKIVAFREWIIDISISRDENP